MKISQSVSSLFALKQAPSMINQKGASLIEVIAYLGVAGLIIGGALAMYSSATGAQSSNQLTAEIAGTRTSIKSLYAATSAYGTTTLIYTLASAGRMPSTWTIGGTLGATETATSETGGSVGLIGATSTFIETLDTLTASQCTSVLAQQTNQGWTTVYLGVGAVAPGTATATTTTLVASGSTPAAIAALCATAAVGGYAKISLTN